MYPLFQAPCGPDMELSHSPPKFSHTPSVEASPPGPRAPAGLCPAFCHTTPVGPFLRCHGSGIGQLKTLLVVSVGLTILTYPNPLHIVINLA